MNRILEELEFMKDESEKTRRSQNLKFDDIEEELQSIKKSVLKISKTQDDEKKLREKSIVQNQNNGKIDSGKRFLLKHVFENVSDLGEGKAVNSENEDHFNLKWCMAIERNGSHLAFHVFLDPIDTDVEDEWSVKTKLEFKMIGKNNKRVIKTDEYCFEVTDDDGYGIFLEWEDINDYLIDDNLTAEIEVEILEISGFGRQKLRNFDESQKDVSDVILVVQDTKFYLSRMYLASQSSYFKTLFLGKFSESRKSEIPLTGIDSNDFQCFLEVLYGENAIDESTVEGILLVGDFYDTSIVTRKCQEFLLEESEKNLKKKLQLSTQYRLKSLEDQCLSKINSIDDVKEFLPGDLSDLDSSVAHKILQICVSSA
ncbi:hypothetical protein B9Z55_007111 [Caenorhabditis nigoni]|nr:hypothetical protein B9Z55_007111 [Caenorhabditis nigoni]